MPLPSDSWGIIGSGPMAIYLLKHLINAADALERDTFLEITVLEASDSPGTGMPYRPEMNADFMLGNAFSREIPSVTQPLLDWLLGLSDAELARWNLTRRDLTTRSFYPRLLLGAYYAAEFETLCTAARARGHGVRVLPRHRVTDILPGTASSTCLVETPAGTRRFTFGTVVIATGHHFEEHPRLGTAELVSPWPATRLAALPAGRIGILGSSLSAIDVAVALGQMHGSFQDEGAQMRWFPHDTASDLRLTMVSRRGIMPEADFYYTYPHAPLRHLTEEAVAREVDAGAEGLLDRVFALLLAELHDADPTYLEGLGPEAATIPGFAEAYFARRQALGGLRSLRETLAEARETMRRKTTVPHRSVLLRGHEAFDAALRVLTPQDWESFSTHLMPVFADCYAAVPDLSVSRVLALFEAGVLDLVGTGDAEGAIAAAPGGGITLTLPDGQRELDLMIDARGQPAEPLSDLPFPGLVAALADPQGALEAPFRLALAGQEGAGPAIYCLAMPQVIARHPFSQGLANCADLSRAVAAAALSN